MLPTKNNENGMETEEAESVEFKGALVHLGVSFREFLDHALTKWPQGGPPPPGLAETPVNEMRITREECNDVRHTPLSRFVVAAAVMLL